VTEIRDEKRREERVKRQRGGGVRERLENGDGNQTY